jgi:hypothetical protein
MSPEPVAGFVPTSGQDLAARRFNVAFRPVATPILEPVTKFGGQPVWIEEPEWPMSRSTGRPMRFICQIGLGDAGLGEPHTARVAYLFMTDSEAYPGQPAVYGQYDPSGGENAVIIQPGADRPVVTMPLPTGPTLTALRPGSFSPDPTRPVEFAVSLTQDSDPPFRSYPEPAPESHVIRAATDSMPVAPVDDASAPNDFDWNAYFEAIGGNKLGGTPNPIDPRILGFSPERASLVLQLDMAEVPFFVDFGDVGVGHLFFDPGDDKGYFTWSSG